MFTLFKNVYSFSYADFEGRASMKEYWSFYGMFYIIYIILLIGTLILANVAQLLGLLMVVIVFVYLLGSMIPMLALTIRRMHDVGKSGWFSLIPIYSLILIFTPGDHGENEYGDDPREIEELI